MRMAIIIASLLLLHPMSNSHAKVIEPGEAIYATVTFRGTLTNPQPSPDYFGLSGTNVVIERTNDIRNVNEIPLINITGLYEGKARFSGFSSRFPLGGGISRSISLEDRSINENVSVFAGFTVDVNNVEQIIASVFDRRDLTIIPKATIFDVLNGGNEDFDVSLVGRLRYRQTVAFASDAGPVGIDLLQEYDIENITWSYGARVVPLPAAAPMFIAGLAAMGFARRWKKGRAPRG